MTGIEDRPAHEENQTRRTMPKAGRSLRQIERIAQQRKLLILTSSMNRVAEAKII